MLNRVNFWSLFLFIVCSTLFCKLKSTQTNSSSGDTTQRKSNSDTSKFPLTSDSAKNNSLKKFDTLSSYFYPHISGHSIDEEKTIPFQVISNFLSADEYDTTSLFYISVNPVCIFRNFYGTYFIVKVNCTAGAICATYYLLSFDTNRRFINNKMIGEETGEERESYQIKHHFISDTILKVDKIRYNNFNDRKIDSIVERFKLKN